MKIFNLLLIKPSHYDDDGYVIQWLRSGIPSNTLAVLYGLASDSAERRVLGEDVEIRITAMDETNTRVEVKKLVRMLRRSGGRSLVCMVGVQSNQFPRAMDIARPFRRENVNVCIGGFHVSGIIAMLPELTPELQEALDLGISLFAGEAESRFDALIRDAWRDELKPVYNYIGDLANIEGAPVPIMPANIIKKNAGAVTSVDAGRGCPFVCNFCSIINVHGHKSRFRTPDDIERIVRANNAQGIHRIFITDDNFARNKNWEPILDRLIELREKEGLRANLYIQADAQSDRIPRFIEKCVAAGVKRVFIGLESINPKNLAAANKKQNRVSEFRRNLLAWRDAGVFTDVAYIIGFPDDTPESIRQDVATLHRELPMERLEFSVMTPLPGSQNHKDMYLNGEYMDPDLNKYDLYHATAGHPKMSGAELQRSYQQAWADYYSEENIITYLKRARAGGVSMGKILGSTVVYYLVATLEDIHPLEAGVIRRKYRKDRRPGLPIESPSLFYSKYAWTIVYKYGSALLTLWKFSRVRKRLDADPGSKNYTDRAITEGE
ncbi:MAG: B12-binding domain-containing radical SAM protein [Thermodesulfobacteriota bacterium]